MSEIKFRMTAGTNVGSVRTNNEDNFIVNENLSNKEWYVPECSSTEFDLGENGAILVVADGMGGMNAGEVASAIAIDTIKDLFTMDSFSDIVSSTAKISAFMKDAVIEADARIKAKVKEDSSTSGMGTTIVIAWILGDIAHIVWCGDSRAYLFNPNSGLSRLTKDHSYVQDLVDAGKLDPELAFDHPNSNIITRSLGDSNSKARPDYLSKKLNQDDILLLCSDGLSGLCRDEEIAQVLSCSESLEQCRADLISAALQAGGYDNVTVALLQISSMDIDEDTNIVETSNDLKMAKQRKRKSTWITVAIVVSILLAGLGVWLYYSGYWVVIWENLCLIAENVASYVNSLFQTRN